MEIQAGYTAENLLEAMLQSRQIKVFWKDTDRRFVGANQAFLDFYGFTSVDEVRGKTDEDMGWHIDPVPFQTDELDVLKEGKWISGAEGTCIVHGEIHYIRAHKSPIYNDEGEIAGLVGYFTDITDEVRERGDKKTGVNRSDRLTGLMNENGLLEQLGIYIDGYQSRGLDFACVLMNVDDFVKVNENYGRELADELLINIAESFARTMATGGVLARIHTDSFAILHQITGREQVDTLVARLRMALNKVDALTSSVRPGMSVGTAIYSEVENGEELLRLAQSRMEENKSLRKGSGIEGGMA